MIICSVFGYSKSTSFVSSVSLAQISEFSLIILSQGLILGQISQEISQAWKVSQELGKYLKKVSQACLISQRNISSSANISRKYLKPAKYLKEISQAWKYLKNISPTPKISQPKISQGQIYQDSIKESHIHKCIRISKRAQREMDSVDNYMRHWYEVLDTNSNGDIDDTE